MERGPSEVKLGPGRAWTLACGGARAPAVETSAEGLAKAGSAGSSPRCKARPSRPSTLGPSRPLGLARPPGTRQAIYSSSSCLAGAPKTALVWLGVVQVKGKIGIASLTEEVGSSALTMGSLAPFLGW